VAILHRRSSAGEGPRRRARRRVLRFASSIVGGILVALVGWTITDASLDLGEHRSRAASRGRWFAIALAEKFARLSYDLHFILTPATQLPDACIIYLDERSAAALGQQSGVWDRRLHAQLVRHLSQEGARAIFFDVVFAGPWPEAGVDEDLAGAMKEHGEVFIGAALELDAGHGAHQERVIPPVPILRRAAAGWGLLAFRPIDADYGVRRIFTGTEDIPAATWVAATKLGAPLSEPMRAGGAPRWLRYYGPADSFPNISYDRALIPDGLPPGYFKDRLVFVGGRSTLDVLMLGKDDFRNPYSLLGGRFSKGVEVHLTTLLNLLRGDWLRRLPAREELWLVTVLGVLMGAGLPLFRPHLAALLAFAAALGMVAFVVWLFAEHRVWFAWCIPLVIQMPVALVWALSSRYFLEERRRRALRLAFAHYLSPHMADRVAEEDFDLAPGGVMMEATIMFTDLEGFTALSEKLNNPEQMAGVLTTYFTRTTAHILENDGTVIKYLGDAVEAVWGAPLADENQAYKAALAAWRLHQDARAECDGHLLCTRIGMSAGRVLSGNLGSAQRFDYGVIGDAVNLASRLEGLNKLLGTAILISDSLQRQLRDQFVTRCVGAFVVLGKTEACIVHELMGPAESTTVQSWQGSFGQALAAYGAGDFPGAKQLFQLTIEQRAGFDGPSAFYLRRIETSEDWAAGKPWTGVVELAGK
jgi:adenylate cyclase